MTSPDIPARCFRRFPLTTYINYPTASRALCTNMTRQSAPSKTGKRQRPFLPYSPFGTTEASATLFSSLANGGGRVRLAFNRRPDVPENVGGPASCGNAERLGPHQDLRPLATPTGVGVPLSHEELNPGTRKTGHSAGGEAGARACTGSGSTRTKQSHWVASPAFSRPASTRSSGSGRAL